MFDRLRHWLIPHHTNNYRARFLHNAGLTILIAAFLSFSAFTRLLESTPLHILGFTSSITIDEVITQTNAERLSLGLPALKGREAFHKGRRSRDSSAHTPDLCGIWEACR